ncbi:Trigger factor [Caldalkalibacillus thermarum TA2.A1]|uniref:Trigger factor n=1 Tax=Caldalkalibacillus thermarum (strain TA2.A1) TaxID=986075 RepID=F5LAJ5_CALTT|nr:trigger factor [Caldalkalibacillus thermarum]EGL81567.1 Trigger factor [Caldalkalibacillus thermarum TA2.A1]QZT33542.1 trigger factor [Caldalkalibacillus thermarum TA2.A1]
MSAKWEKIDNHQGVLTVEVDKEEFAKALDEAFKKVVKKVQVPGFRKGRVPRKIFEARFGVEALYQDALDIILPKAYQQAVEETGIEPVDRPEVDIEQLEKDKNLIFKATVTVKPEVQLGEYKGLEVPEKDFSVTDEQVEEELNRIRERQAELIVVEDGEIQEGDMAVINFEGFIDGEPFEGGKGENYSLEIGSNTFIPGFEDQLIGMKKGEEKEIKVTFPEDYHAEEYRGKEATFKVKVNEIKRKKLPELDDEFAKDVSEFDTLEEYKADLRKKLEARAKEEEENYKRETVVEKAAENATIDIPQVMIDHEIEHMISDFEQRLRLQGLDLDTYFKFSGTDLEGLKEQFKEAAEKRVRINLTLEAIAKAENIEVTEEDMEAELERLAELYGRDKDEIKKVFLGQGNESSIREDIKIRKTIDLLVNHSKTVA